MHQTVQGSSGLILATKNGCFNAKLKGFWRKINHFRLQKTTSGFEIQKMHFLKPIFLQKMELLGKNKNCYNKVHTLIDLLMQKNKKCKKKNKIPDSAP